MRIVLLGAPGSGKGTQSTFLHKKFGIPQISTGDLLRAAVAAGSEFGQKAKRAMDAGQLVSDDLVLGILRERLSNDDSKDGFILDGYPRNAAQAESLDQLLDEMDKPLDTVILLDVPQEILMKRLTGRRNCSVTGKLLNIHFSPQSEIDACLDVGGELIQRDDDNEETIANRLDVFKSQTEPLIRLYELRGLLCRVGGDGSPQAIFKYIDTALA